MLLCGVGLFAEAAIQNPPLFNWSLLSSGSWVENRTLHNRGDLRINILPLDIMLRGQMIGRTPLNFEIDPIWGDTSRWVGNPAGGLYHTPTGSRFLYGILDEWGLPARIRNPWIRSAPFAENRRPVMADLRTAISVTREPEAYLYLSSPVLNISPKLRLRGFVSAQTKIENFNPDFSGGIDLRLERNTSLLLETFYTGSTLAATRSTSWFSSPPPLPQREFRLYALALAFNNPLISLTSDFAYSETFAWGTGIYGSAGLRINPPLPDAMTDFLRSRWGNRYPARPLFISFAADGAGQKFTGRDGTSAGPGFRCAGRIEWRGTRSSLLRINTTLRSPDIGGNFNRSSSGFLYRFPAQPRAADSSLPLRITRISFTADRNAADTERIADSFRGSFGFAYRLPENPITSSLGINLTGSIRGLSSANETPSPYPFFGNSWNFDSAAASVEFSWSMFSIQFSTKCGYTANANRNDQWEIAAGAAIRFRQGRFSLRFSSPNFPDTWNCTVSWRLEKR